MNSKYLPFVLIGAVIVLGLGGFLLYQNKPSTTPTNMEQSEQGSGAESLKDLLSGNSSQECMFEDTENGNSGLVYVADGKMKGDFVLKSDEGDIASSVIVDGSTMYSWMADSTMGYKITFDPEDLEEAKEEAREGSVDLNQKVNLDCKPWAADQSVFTPPSNLTFQEFNVPAMPSGAGGAGANCATCSYLSGEAKTSCLQALKCEE